MSSNYMINTKERKGVFDDLLPSERIDMMNNRKEDLFKTLKQRELEVLHLLALGLSNRDIATNLDLTEGTIRVYLSNIYAKIGVSSRTQAVLAMKENEMREFYSMKQTNKGKDSVQDSKENAEIIQDQLFKVFVDNT